MTSAASSGFSVRRSTYPVIAAWFAAYTSSNLRRRASAALVSDVRTAVPLDTSHMSASDESISRSTLQRKKRSPTQVALPGTWASGAIWETTQDRGHRPLLHHDPEHMRNDLRHERWRQPRPARSAAQVRQFGLGGLRSRVPAAWFSARHMTTRRRSHD